MSDTSNNNEHNTQQEFTGATYPPKPIIIEKRENVVRRSMVSLAIYGLLFYFLFDQNIAYIAALLVVLIIHEMGHFLFMKLFNYNNVKIFIIPLLGAYTSGKKQQVSQKQLTMIILGGPVPGIIIGLVLYVLNRDWQDNNVRMLCNTFLIINLFNCLPFYPLDGGRLIETLFFKENYVLRMIFGIVSLLALVLLFFWNGMANPFFLIIPVFIGLELYNEYRHNKIREYLKQEKVNYCLDYENLPDKDYWFIRDCLILSFPKKYAAIPAGKYEYSILESAFINHISAVLQVNLNFDMGVFAKVLTVLFYLLLFFGPVLMYLFYNGFFVA
ncbi:MAG: site-2 protease family protein [Bacteroidia bacterium]|nr:site-2 protease family protein [Bacteroidia bacterium]